MVQPPRVAGNVVAARVLVFPELSLTGYDELVTATLTR